MPELPREELDKVFREGADQYDFQFKPEAWDHMESLLDRERRRRIVLWWWLGVSGLLVLIFGLGFYFYRADVSAQDPILKHSTEEPVAHTAAPKTDHQNDSPHTRQLPGVLQDNNKAETAEKEEDSRTVIQARPGKPDTRKTSGNSAGTAAGSDKKSSASTADRLPGIASDAANDEQDTELQKRGAVAVIPPASTDPASAMEPAAAIFALEALPHRMYSPVVSQALPDSLAFGPVHRQTAATAPGGRAKFILGASFASELVGVGMNDFSRLGLKAGLSAEYLYFRRLGIGAGILFLRKSYLAEKGEYHPPYGFWTRKIAPIYTDGHCNIIEIPLNLSYYTRGYDRSGVYGSFGASSYIMLKEKYTYEYDVPDTDLIMDWSSRQAVEHWLGMLNFSAGYMGPLSNKLAYRLALYGQVPLEGVGHGQVHLQSFGVQFFVSFQKMGERDVEILR